VSEPRVSSRPVPGDEALAPAAPDAGIPAGSAPEHQPDDHEQVKKSLAKIHWKPSDNAELLKRHAKHYHMSPENFKKRTSQLQLPQRSIRTMRRLYVRVRRVHRMHQHQSARE